MMTDIVIRPYEQKDRDAVRRIIMENADGGKPVSGPPAWHELVADLLTAFYTDLEPENSWTAESGREAVGFLSGCTDTRRYLRAIRFRIMPASFFQACLKGALMNSGFWKLIKAALKVWLSGGRDPDALLDKYPAHVHINVTKDFRKKNIGRGLLGCFMNKLKAEKVPGVYASVREDNTPARAFFERSGFKELIKQPVIRFDNKTAYTGYAVIYGKETDR